MRLQNRWLSINNLRYADDTVILAETEHELQHLMDIVVQECEHKGLFLNIDKSYTSCYGHKINLPRFNDLLISEARNQQQRQEYV